MARKTKTDKKREDVEKSLRDALGRRGRDDMFYMDKVDEYMQLFDVRNWCIAGLNDVRSRGEAWKRESLDLIAETRRIGTRMDAILTLLGMKLPEDKTVTADVEDDL